MKRLLVPLVAVTVAGGGGGGFLGYSLLAGGESSTNDAARGKEQAARAIEAGGQEKGAPRGAHAEAKGSVAHDGGHGDGHGAGHDGAKSGGGEQAVASAPPQLKVKELPPIVANLGGKERAWVRIQSAIVYDAHELEHVDTMIPVLLSDITAFVGTLELPAIEGPDGLRRLQEELNERAATRSEGRIKELIVEALVVQ